MRNKLETRHWYQLNALEVISQLDSNTTQGLSQADAAQRLQDFGLNELTEQPSHSVWQLLWQQLTGTLVVILLIAALLSTVLGDYHDATAILVIVVFNAFLGFRQEYRAEKAIAALKKLAVPTVKVRRDGIIEQISARQLVPGDVVILETGNLVPADGRLLESVNLRIQEAALTGESEPIDKTAQALGLAELPLGDRRNMVYTGTLITYGRGLAVITATGSNTELGQIATSIQAVEQTPTRLQQRLDQLGWQLGVVIFGIVIVIFTLGLLRGEELRFMFLTAVSLAVAAVPEGLPAIVAIALALGAQRMLQKQALIRRLPAVETLGSVTVICADKTGTLTENRMAVAVLALADFQMDLQPLSDEYTTLVDSTGPLNPPIHSPSGHPGKGDFDSYSSQNIAIAGIPEREARGAETAVTRYFDASWGLALPLTRLQEQPMIAVLLVGAALCNDALLERDREPSQPFRVLGDPTEAALVLAAARLGLIKPVLEQGLTRLSEIPFAAERQRMTTIHQLPTSAVSLADLGEPLTGWVRSLGNSPCVAFSKGSVNSLLSISSQVWLKGRSEPLGDRWRQHILETNNQLAQEGMRVLAVAFRVLERSPTVLVPGTLEQDFTLVGLLGIVDPARPEVKQAVAICKHAGIRPVMITGDQALTAQHIARELEMMPNNQMLTGPEIDQLSTQALEAAVEEVAIYARVSPQHKLAIVQALQNRGHIVAMTGDGINDAPALRQADIGIAMGLTGTDVAKEASDMLLLDDNFATIVAAVKEGRVIYDNIRKFIRYTLTGNCGELWVILIAPFLGMPLPLLPLQILWINLLADGLLAVALSVEPAEPQAMHRSPYNPNESFWGRGVGRDIAWIGLLLGLVLLAIAYHYWRLENPGWQTMVLTTLAFSRIGMAQTMRSERESWWHLGLVSNKPLLVAVVLTFSLQMLVIYVPFLQTFFATTALSISDLLICVVLSVVVFGAVELEKWLLRSRDRAS